MGIRDAFDRWIGSASEASTTRAEVHGLPVVVHNTRSDIRTADVLARLERVFALIAQVTPHYYRHLLRDFAFVRVERFACRGAFFPPDRSCLVELTFAVNPMFTDSQVAASVIHEGMHARLHALGFPLDFADRPRQERFCRRAEIEFGLLAPDGQAVVDRALGALQQADDEAIAPMIDPALAAQRIAEVDAAAARARN